MALIFALFFFASGFMTFRGADEVSSAFCVAVIYDEQSGQICI